ncbi:hypothetical protein FZEAL_10761 [Fusarium zealandicum]|uniref:SWR1-complex protein 5 n=1 Tax=Fusarium zealandicum TaxID=1053134 RepID=A0A8H4TWR2_9HYPO|nr:hypothetical protein FZEAL_10761 [Fusarium zealandicum]
MPPDPIDEDEQYASSEDSDFAPDAAPEQASEHSDSEDEGDKPTGKRSRPVDDREAADVGYENSGDEAIIKKGEKRRKRSRAKGTHGDEDEGGEGGLIKTRRQRAAEKEERKYATNNEPVTVDVDALWAQMISGAPTGSKSDQADSTNTNTDSAAKEGKDVQQRTKPILSDDPSATIRIRRTYNFAGRVHTEEKLVPRDSAEAKLYLASQNQENAPIDGPEKRVTRKAFRSAFEPLTEPLLQRADLNLGMAARIKAGKEAQAKKLNVVEKSRMDWAGYVDKEGIKAELELAGKSKDSYMAREDFLAKSEALREEESRRARLAGKA